MPDESERDLTEQLADAAHAAVLNRRASIVHEQGSLRSITIELELNARGRITGAGAFVESRLSPTEIFGRRRAR
jgi:hypothetical protein